MSARCFGWVHRSMPGCAHSTGRIPPSTVDEGRELRRQRERGEMLIDFIALNQCLKEHAQCAGRVGVVGFCSGGWTSNITESMSFMEHQFHPYWSLMSPFNYF